MVKFLANVDLSGQEVQNAAGHRLAAPPLDPSIGQKYYDIELGYERVWTGVAWERASGIDVGAGIPTDAEANSISSPGTALKEVARVDHVHNVKVGNPTASAPGDPAAPGTDTALARADHTHARENFGAAASPSTPGDLGAPGTDPAVARADHEHSRESFGSVVPETAYDGTSSPGTANDLARSDHRHGTPAHGDDEHSTIPLSAFAAPTTSMDMGGQRMTNADAPSAPGDIATKGYVDAAAQGLQIREAVDAATVGPITLSGGQTIDTVTLSVGDRVLVKDQITPADNGIYVVSAVTWLRSTDLDESGEFPKSYVFVRDGNVNAFTGWVCTNETDPTVGIDPIDWTQFSAAGTMVAGDGMTRTGTVLDVVAGPGIVVDADSVAADLGVSEPLAPGDPTAGVLTSVARADHVHPSDPAAPLMHRQTLLGTGAWTTALVPHNLGTKDVVVQVFDGDSPNESVHVDVHRVTDDAVLIIFALAPAVGETYRVVVMG